jgi:hypothetical protein
MTLRDVSLRFEPACEINLPSAKAVEEVWDASFVPFTFLFLQ